MLPIAAILETDHNVTSSLCISSGTRERCVPVVTMFSHTGQHEYDQDDVRNSL